MSLLSDPLAASFTDTYRQKVFSMFEPIMKSRHHGLLHQLEANASTTSTSHDGPLNSTASAVASAFNITVAAHHGKNSTENSGQHEQETGHRPIWYISRGFPLLCLAVVLLLGLHHGITTLRHKRRIRLQLKRAGDVPSKSGHIPVATEDPDEEPSSPNGTFSDSTLVEQRSPKTHVHEIEEHLLEMDSAQIEIAYDHHSVRRGSGRFCFSAWEATQRNWLYLRTIPGWLYGPETIADALWTIVYSLLMFIFALTTIPLDNNEFWYLYLANGLGVLAFCQCPLIIVLIQKNNPISLLTGITYQKLNYLHRASSRVALLFSWLHFLLWTPRVWYAGHFSHWYIIWGLIAVTGFTGLWITSFRIVRRVAFEFFLIAHIIFTIVFIGGALFHWYRLGFWMWPCFVIWGLDRAIRGTRLLYHNPPPSLRWFQSKNAPKQAGQCRIQLLSQDVMLITAKRPGLKWTAGQHFYLSSPGISTLPSETHPFSIANMPNERDEAVFLVRVHSGFTRKLRDKLSGDLTTDIPIYLEGPYGSSHPVSSYSTVILVAGGTGITFLSSNLLGLLQPNTPQIPRHVHLVWHIRHAADVRWLSSLLNEAAELAQQFPKTRLTFDIHVTKSHRADEPAPAVGFTERLVEEFAPRRFSRRFSRIAVKSEIGGWGDLSEMPSAVVSDDEDDASPIRAVNNTASTVDDIEGSSLGSSTEGDLPGRPVANLSITTPERLDRLDEVDRIAEEGGHDQDTDTLLPKRPVSLKQTTSQLDSFGLSATASSMIFWKKGRADLREVLEHNLESTQGPINMTVCGPVQLMHAARRAVRDVATPARTLKGDWPVDFYEETLGS